MLDDYIQQDFLRLSPKGSIDLMKGFDLKVAQHAEDNGRGYLSPNTNSNETTEKSISGRVPSMQNR